MPIVNPDDAVEVEDRVDRIFAASPADRAGEIRALFVEVLDFDPVSGDVGLDRAPGNVALPASAERVAQLDGVHVLYVALETTETDRVRKGDAAAAARLISDQLGDDLLLIFTNTSSSQIHLIHPSFEGTQPTLRRMIVERDLPLRTAVQQVSNIYWNHQKSGSIRTAVDQTFDVEAVTKAFFEEYKRVFDLGMDSVEGFGDDKEEYESKRLFIQTLFNRLMFIYFLSRKGWLTYGGDNDYLNALWSDYRGNPDQTNFYSDRLYHLFFFGLNNPQSQDLNFKNSFMELIFGDVPFLNGGLFEKAALDTRSGVTVPDGVIESILSDLFDRFNFTVMESTPFDLEVAVDPEMLGKVFEELITERHDTGAYYTPRPIVSFMCRQALKGYLASCDTGLTSEEIEGFVDNRDTSGIGLASAPRVAEALERVTVVDPACGSGAYLLGMMQELIDLQTSLFNVGVDFRSLYELKLHIIQRNLYGVDIDEFAVNIAMLRMWLSLVIEYEGERPEPLPNLDFKVVQGDSLLGPDPGPDNYGDLFRHRAHSVAARIVDLKARHMEATIDKDALREKIERVQGELRLALADTPAPAGSVDWRVEFAEVFDRGGFDVVLANPPYKVISDKQLRALYSDGVYGRMNTYGLFIQRSLQLMSDGSQLFFINPRTLLTDKYFVNLRRVIKKQAQLKGVVLIGDRHNTFERVLQECIIVHLARKLDLTDTYRVDTQAISVPTELNDRQAVISMASNRVLLGREYDDSYYIGESEFDYKVFERMNAMAKKLSDFGLRAETGKIQFDRYREYARTTGNRGECRLMWAENIQRYTLRESSKRVGKEWLAKGITTIVSPNISGTGIVTQRVSANEQPRRIIATLLSSEATGDLLTYSENHTNFIPIEDAPIGYFLIASLNSSLMEYVFRRLNSNTQVSAGELNQLPFPPRPPSPVLSEIKNCVIELLNLGGVDREPRSTLRALEYERRLDELIGSLYGLSPTEVEAIQALVPSYGEVYGLNNESKLGEL